MISELVFAMNGIRECNLGLGIDTGGTYTDAVIVDMATKEVIAKKKALTTYQDLSIGLLEAVDGVLEGEESFVRDIHLVGISTTLATNSILQGRGGSVGLIGIGWKPEDGWEFGAKRSVFISGGHDSRGREMHALDMDEVESAIKHSLQDADAIVVSSFFGILNPSHEERVRDAIRAISTIPIVTGHELTPELGILERTTTAVLNAKLLPIIDDFLSGVEKSLELRHVKAPIMVLKGDGSFMNLGKARSRPVETILSGPAASLMGGKQLSKLERCIVLDIGGTSTDIAYLDKGFSRLQKEGAVVGQWRTRVKAVDIWTTGLGGDSRLDLIDGSIVIGPDRVLPIETACAQYPFLLKKMKELHKTEFLIAFDRDVGILSPGEQIVFDFIRAEGPVTLSEVMQALPDVFLSVEYAKRLIAKNYVILTGPTPTDVLHVAGIYLHGSLEGAKEAVGILASKAHQTIEEFVAKFMERIGSRLAEEVVKKAILDGSGEIPSDKASLHLVRLATSGSEESNISVKLGFDRPIVGIGAPAHIYVPLVKRFIGVDVIIPKDFDVGNAVGAVCSQVSENVEVQILPRDNLFHVYAPDREPSDFETMEQAISAARDMAELLAREKVIEAGGIDVKTLVDVEIKRVNAGVSGQTEIVNWVSVIARAIGKPYLEKTNAKG
jgi:N-methylhydantoinase A/oxoprolinase/acetone carboxylase beta subunit